MNSAQRLDEPSLPTLRIDTRGLIFDATAAPEAEAVAYVTSLVPLESGTFLAGWQSGPGKHTPTNTIGLARSQEGTATWQRLRYDFDTSWQGTPGSFLAARSSVQARR